MQNDQRFKVGLAGGRMKMYNLDRES